MAAYEQTERVEVEVEVEEGMSESELENVLAGEIQDATDYIDNVVSPARALAESYYLGEPFGNEEEGRSTVISMDVRDTVQAILPSLMRVFYGGEHTVEFAPTSAEDVQKASQATDYINYIFRRDNDGFAVLYSAFKDALVKGSGFVKWYWDSTDEIESYTLEGIDEIGLIALTSDPNVSIDYLESRATSENVDPATGEPVMIHDVRVTRTRPKGRVKVTSVPPEEILISRNARSLEEADLVAHRRYLTLSELVQMGYDYDEIEQFATSEDNFDFNAESRERNPTLGNSTDSSADPTMRRALYVESYIRADVDGDSVAELRRICSIGSEYKIFLNEPAEQLPFAVFMPDPEPHTFFGLSIADVTMDVQRIKSMVLRSSLDSLALSTHPRVGVVEGQASMDDVLNTEVGGIIRMRSPGAVVPFSVPFVGRDCFPMLEYMDLVRENRTGVSRAADGLDPAALQSSTALAVSQTIHAAQQRTELIARMFAETGMKKLFEGIFYLVNTRQDAERMIRLRNEFVPIDPRVWDSDMDVIVNVALGRGTEEERIAMLMQIAGKQEQILTTIGPDNPLVSIENYYQTLRQVIELAGFQDTQRFISDPADYQPQPQQPQEPTVDEQLIQVQMESIKADISKKTAELELKREDMIMRDDRERDKTEMEGELRAAEINARYNASVNTEEIRAIAARDRKLIEQETAVETAVVRNLK